MELVRLEPVVGNWPAVLVRLFPWAVAGGAKIAGFTPGAKTVACGFAMGVFLEEQSRENPDGNSPGGDAPGDLHIG